MESSVSILVESGVVGIIASVLGAAAGIGLGFGLLQLLGTVADALDIALTVPPSAMAVGIEARRDTAVEDPSPLVAPLASRSSMLSPATDGAVEPPMVVADIARKPHDPYIQIMAAIDRNSPMPLWAQVLDDLRRRLDAGEFAEEFPTDIDLIQHYDVSRHTAREAVRRLQDEGIVTRERGRGTFVRTPSIEQGTGALYSLFRSLEARGIVQRSHVIDLSAVKDTTVAARFERPANASFVRLERLRYADDVPLAHDVAWIPASIGDPLLEVDFTHTALYDELQARCGVRPMSGTENISTELPPKSERELLRISAKQPVFRIERTSFDGDDMIEWRETLVRGDRYTFVASWSPSGAYEASLDQASAN